MKNRIKLTYHNSILYFSSLDQPKILQQKIVLPSSCDCHFFASMYLLMLVSKPFLSMTRSTSKGHDPPRCFVLSHPLSRIGLVLAIIYISPLRLRPFPSSSRQWSDVGFSWRIRVTDCQLKQVNATLNERSYIAIGIFLDAKKKPELELQMSLVMTESEVIPAFIIQMEGV